MLVFKAHGCAEVKAQLAQKENERAALAQRIHIQTQIDGETWQFQGDSGEWVSFPVSLNVFSMFCLLPECGKATGLYGCPTLSFLHK